MAAAQTFGADPDASGDSYEAQAAADLVVVRGFLARDPVATEQLEQRLQCVPRILGGLNRRIGNPLTADDLADLAQDTALIVLRKLGDYSGAAPIEAWIYRVCSFELRNSLRRKRRIATSDLSETSAIQNSEVEAMERREFVSTALDRIRPPDAAAVRMHKLEGLTFVEISQRVGVSVNKVKGRYYRGIEQLTELMRGTRNREE